MACKVILAPGDHLVPTLGDLAGLGIVIACRSGPSATRDGTLLPR